jgi:hypothetical protein
VSGGIEHEDRVVGDGVDEHVEALLGLEERVLGHLALLELHAKQGEGAEPEDERQDPPST